MICDLTGMEVCQRLALRRRHGAGRGRASWRSTHRPRQAQQDRALARRSTRSTAQVVRTYTQGMGLTIVGDEQLPAAAERRSGASCWTATRRASSCSTRISSAASRTWTGAGGQAAHAAGALLSWSSTRSRWACSSRPASSAPTSSSGEGQPLGIPLVLRRAVPRASSPSSRSYVRQMAGRLVGETVDSRGRRGFVLTLATREQHIRREKATSNICTNQALMALAAAVYLAAVGKQGLRQVAELCYHKAHYAAEQTRARCPGYHAVVPTAVLPRVRRALPAARWPSQRSVLLDEAHPRRLRPGPGLSRADGSHAAVRHRDEHRGQIDALVAGPGGGGP